MVICRKYFRTVPSKDDDFMNIPKPVPSSSNIILNSDKPIPRKITKRIVEGMKGITLNEANCRRGGLRSSDTKAEDKMKRGNEYVLDVAMEKGIRIPKREVHLPRIVLPNISVEYIRSATLAWNVEWLRKREISEIENGGLGSAPLLERTHDPPMNNNEFTPLHDDSVKKGLDDLEREREVLSWLPNMTQMLLESFIAKYHGDEIFKKYKYILGDILRYEAKDGGRENDDCGEASNKMNECQVDATRKDLVLSQGPQTESFAEMDIHQTPIS
ncbi:hypothetical protein L6452_42137 [Arctium lappa]|uniref:Uncharacterized protein n=1 Tax=Arctium lappa TaxID=4217 RepID=A0ACB8XHN2_ARCLA|nr:hypothetical protein L6452_42137 [Arctium lappa]